MSDRNLGGWIAELTVTAPHVPHVMPVADMREHNKSAECWCGPTNDKGVMVHHSLDRREAYERSGALH